MNTTEDRARAAMRAIAWTVNDAPPLRLPRRHSTAPAPRARRRRWRPWIAPLAAAMAVLAIAVTLVAVRGKPGIEAVPKVVPPPAAAVPPRYYVALNESNFTASLVVGDTLTGAKVATMPAPADDTFSGVTAAADDRTFVVDTRAGLLDDEGSPLQPRTFYLLRIAPGSAHPAKLTRLPIPAITYVNAIALSPDASKLAVASQPGWDVSTHARVYLRVYSVATGAVLRSWTAKDGSAVFGGPAYGGPDRNDVLFWRSDGRALSFTSTWRVGVPKPVNGSAVQPTAAQARNIRTYATVRTLELAGAGTDLIADSRLALTTVTRWIQGPSSPLECVSPDLLVSPDGKVVVCGATDVSRNPGARASIGCQAARPWRDLGFLKYSAVTGRLLTVLDKYPTNCNTALSAVYALWVSQSGGAVIGYVGPGPGSLPGQRQPARRYGVFRQGRFTPLPAPLTGGDPVALCMIAW
jgi:hypothetical protein